MNNASWNEWWRVKNRAFSPESRREANEYNRCRRSRAQKYTVVKDIVISTNACIVYDGKEHGVNGLSSISRRSAYALDLYAGYHK